MCVCEHQAPCSAPLLCEGSGQLQMGKLRLRGRRTLGLVRVEQGSPSRAGWSGQRSPMRTWRPSADLGACPSGKKKEWGFSDPQVLPSCSPLPPYLCLGEEMGDVSATALGHPRRDLCILDPWLTAAGFFFFPQPGFSSPSMNLWAPKPQFPGPCCPSFPAPYGPLPVPAGRWLPKCGSRCPGNAAALPIPAGAAAAPWG